MLFHTVLLLAVSAAEGTSAVSPPVPVLPVPSAEQLAWQKLEYGMFCHFGINTFYDQEWGEGTEDPARFNPTDFDARQWVLTAKDCGMKYLVVTAKHHDGFCLFPSAHTEHSLKASPWRDGQGDVIKAVADACHDLGVMFGFYLSPWDRHEPKYADSAAYDIHFKSQLRELLTNYGAVGEVWFDGAGSKGHVYDWAGYYALIREHQPQALIAICGPDIRWVGNEQGYAPETLWNVQDRDGEKVWHPAECDVPIRKGQWFWHPDSEGNVKSLDELLDIYYGSVGRGAVLLLNVTPDDTGQLPEADVARLHELWAVISDTFDENLAAGQPATASNVRGDDARFGADKAVDGNTDTYWATDDGVTTATLDIDLGAPITFNRVMVQEEISLGQRVEAYHIEVLDGGTWRDIVHGTTIGHKKLDRFDTVTASKVRLSIDKALASPVISQFGLYLAEKE